MKSRRRLAPLLPWTMLAVLAMGCDGTVIITDPDDGAVSFQTIVQSQASGIEDSREQIIESRSEWTAVWSEIGRGGPPPAVDFGRDMIALVAAGSRPNGCYTIEIRSIDLHGGLLRIDADLNEPGDNCLCPQGIVQPVHAVRLRRISRRADFDLRRVVQDCR
ncbi:MAG TPA: protease complex subunit PrcB family protein [Thermoanaerobaculia bacterium]|nr:protease complex subunit PrcB family protein [Thermoanaerobaculia bacterium]